MSQPYAEVMAIRPYVSYTTYATTMKEQTSYIIMFVQFEEWNLSSETRDDAESGEESDDDSIMPQLIRKEET